MLQAGAIVQADATAGLLARDTLTLGDALDATVEVAGEQYVQRSRRVGERDHSATSEQHATGGRAPGQELGQLGATLALVEVHPLDRLAGEHARRPRQAGDESARALDVPAGGEKRRGERTVEERHAECVGDARRDEVAARAVLGRHRHDRSVGAKGACRLATHYPRSFTGPPDCASSGSGPARWMQSRSSSRFLRAGRLGISTRFCGALGDEYDRAPGCADEAGRDRAEDLAAQGPAAPGPGDGEARPVFAGGAREFVGRVAVLDVHAHEVAVQSCGQRLRVSHGALRVF